RLGAAGSRRTTGPRGRGEEAPQRSLPVGPAPGLAKGQDASLARGKREMGDCSSGTLKKGRRAEHLPSRVRRVGVRGCRRLPDERIGAVVIPTAVGKVFLAPSPLGPLSRIVGAE